MLNLNVWRLRHRCISDLIIYQLVFPLPPCSRFGSRRARWDAEMQSVRIVVDIGKSGKGPAEFETNRIAWSARSALQKCGSLYTVSVVFGNFLSLLSCCHHHQLVHSRQGSIHFILRELDNKRLELVLVWFNWLIHHAPTHQPIYSPLPAFL